MSYFSQENVPSSIAADIRGSDVYCESCKRTFEIFALDPVTTIRMRLVER